MLQHTCKDSNGRKPGALRQPSGSLSGLAHQELFVKEKFDVSAAHVKNMTNVIMLMTRLVQSAARKVSHALFTVDVLHDE